MEGCAGIENNTEYDAGGIRDIRPDTGNGY